MYIARALANPEQFQTAIEEIPLPHGIQSLRVRLGSDWDDNPAAFFQVVLMDNCGSMDEVLSLIRKFSKTVELRLRPLEDWGVSPYFDFLPESEYSKTNNLALV